MRLFRVGILCALAGTFVACSGDDEGVLNTPDPVAGLRYVNLVSDTGAMDFRVVDVISNAPNQTAAAFRTGGNPSGVLTPFLPPYQAVLADGSPRSIRVFMSSANQAVATTVMFDTTFTFTPGSNYTMYLYGTARTGTAGRCCSAIITEDITPATLYADSFAVRVIHLAPSMAPTIASTTVDVFVDTLAAAAAPVGTPTFAAVTYGEVRPYVHRRTRAAVAGPPAVAALNYRGAVTASSTLAPFVQADVPNGTAGNATTNPLAGDLVAGTAISIVIVPASVTGSQATAFATPSAIYLIDRHPPRTAP